MKKALQCHHVNSRRSCLIIFLTVFISLLFQTGYCLSTVIDYQKEECVSFEVRPTDDIAGSYMILPKTARRINVRITEVTNKDKVVYQTEGQLEGQFQLKPSSTDENPNAQRPSYYTMCFKNNDGAPRIASFTLRTGENRFFAVATGDATASLNTQAQKLREKVLELSDQLDYAIQREEVHRSTAESTNRRVFAWVFFKVMVVIALIIVEALYFRSYFEIKTIV